MDDFPFRSVRSLRRRAFLHQGALCLAGLGGGLRAAEKVAPLVRAGLMTDLHYADKPPTKTRFYREALGKIDEAVAVFEREKPAFVVELGDLIDQADSVEVEMGWLERMESHYAKLSMPRHYVLGNHCVTTLTKGEFAAGTGASATPHYHFEQGGVTFVVLDACYRQDGTPYQRKNFSWQDANIPEAELKWLESVLANAAGPVVVFGHQRLDESPAHAVRNAAAVRAVFEKSGKVAAVFQGHSHKNDYQEIAGIHYTTLVAMVEGSGEANNGYGLLEVFGDGSLRLAGFRQQVDCSLVRG